MADLDSPVQVSDVAPATETGVVDSADTYQPDLDISSLANFFGYQHSDEILNADSQQMKTIWNYFAPQAESQGEVLRLISQAERELAQPQIGETRLGKLYLYVRLLQEESSIKDEISAYRKY